MPKVTLNTIPSERLARRLAEQTDVLLSGEEPSSDLFKSETAFAWWYPGLNMLNWISLIKLSGEHELARALEDCALHKDPQ